MAVYGNEDLVDVEAVVAGVLVLGLHYADDLVRNVVEVNVFADGVAAGEELFAHFRAQKCDPTALGHVVPVVEAAFADVDGPHFGKGRPGAGNHLRAGVVVAVQANAALADLRQDPLAVGRLLR